ncbi:hypothetical protein A3N42_22590 [Klebsiella aerogenes]|uniref:hypothetical protein n=1 Tax=Klebsiella aerogenes TaxID=548 RepID=UPI0007B31E5E|nr:hypothetical protein [Klebsiella aerogenes]KZP98490.1 hypothetical protein A3N42_22590 [Klebsiella aerogenes]
MLNHILRYFRCYKNYSSEFETESNYFDNFSKAAYFTKKLGFNEKWKGLAKGREYDYQDVFDHVYSQSGVTGFSASAGQCLKWTHYLQPYFEDAMECRVWVTVGQLWKEGTFVYNPSVEDFQRWSKKGLQPEDFGTHSGFNFHAWLTTENGVIIDVSFMSTLAQVLPDCYSEASGGVIFGKPENILRGHKYVPMIIGKKIIEKMERLSFFDFLAEDYTDLYTVPFVLVPDVQR